MRDLLFFLEKLLNPDLFDPLVFSDPFFSQAVGEARFVTWEILAFIAKKDITVLRAMRDNAIGL
jgi:hypothetical protein